VTPVDSLRSWMQAHRTLQILLVVVFGILLFSATADEPLQLDNMDFPAVARATSVSGVPIYYRGEESPKHSGLYHPPLYIYALAAWIKLFGFGEVPVRMFGIACALLQAGIVLAIIQTLLGRKRARHIAPWFLAAFLLNPYTLQTASIADIDSTVYGPVLCAILLYTLRLTWRNGERRTDTVGLGEFAVISFFVALGLWAKLTTILLLVAVLPLLLVARFGWAKAVLTSVLVTGTGVAAFAASYWAYGVLTGLDVTQTVKFTIYSFLTRGSSGNSGIMARISDKLTNFPIMAPIHIQWTGLFPWVIVLCACVLSFWYAARRKSALHAHIAVVLGTALATTVYYCGQTLTFGGAPFKYTFVYWALVIAAPALLAFLLYGSVDMFHNGWSIAVAALVFCISSYIGLMVIRDAIIVGATEPQRNVWIWRAPAVAALLSIALARNWKAHSRGLLAASLSAYVGLNAGIALYHARVPYSTTYDYGQMGFTDTVAFVRTNTTPESVIVSMKDIGFAADRRYFENYDGLYGGPDSARRLQQMIASGKTQYAIFTEGRGQDQLAISPGFTEWIQANTTLIRSFGHYRIYRPKAAELAAGKN
jgi:hypothetical protein